MISFAGMTMDRASKLNAQHGFSLLEALVTIVVVSVGLLGILGLQTASLVNIQVSASRSNATVAADSFAARMQANPEADYDGLASYTAVGTKPSDLPDCDADSGTTCNKNQILDLALWEWSKTLQHKLPNGRGFVDCADSTCDNYRITIVWDEHDPTQDDNTVTDLCDDDPPGRKVTARCFVIEVRI